MQKESKKLVDDQFIVEAHKLATKNIAYMIFGTLDEQGNAHFESGTCFFLQTPLKTIAVTARHVFDRYRQVREINKSTKMQIGNLPFDAETRLTGLGERADIATFEITEAELKRINKYPITLWPPDPPDADDHGVLLAGFPARVIEMTGARTGLFGIYTASGIAQRTTDWQLTCQMEWEHSLAIPELGGLPPQQFETGGMSGGPVLKIRQRNGILSFPLAGVISEGFAERDIIIADRADFIRADGSIRK